MQKSSKAALLWLHAAHNHVNLRLRADDEANPKLVADGNTRPQGLVNEFHPRSLQCGANTTQAQLLR